MTKILASIISYNGFQYLPDCINSCKKSGIDILVIDNHSKDGSIEYLTAEKDINLIKNSLNLGFTKAANQAIEYAINNEFEYLLLLNQDTEYEKEMLTLLIENMEQDNLIAIVSPIYFNEYSNLEYQFKYNLKDFNIELENNQTPSIEVPFVNAACWLIDLKKINLIGNFNEIFKNYGSDLDFCNRTIFSGFKIYINKNAIITHKKEDFDYQNDLIKTVKLHNAFYIVYLINPIKKVTIQGFYISRTKKVIKSFIKFDLKDCMLNLITIFYIAFRLNKILEIRKNL